MGKGKKLGLGCLSLLGILVIAGFVLYMIANESRPTGQSGPEADQLANDMLAALDKPAWDSLNYIQWTFKGGHEFVWDKRANKAVVKWEQNKVILNLDEVDGAAFSGKTLLEGNAKQQAIQKAWSHWCNDSFWLGAQYKVFDPGTKRSLVALDDNNKGLLVEYVSGGVTPGDAYLWALDKNNMPVYWKMWTKIIPIGGVKTTWENWKTVSGGAKVAQKHMLGPADISITNVHAGQVLADLEVEGNPFVFN